MYSRHHNITKRITNITSWEPTQTPLCLNSLESVIVRRTSELVKGRRQGANFKGTGGENSKPAKIREKTYTQFIFVLVKPNA